MKIIIFKDHGNQTWLNVDKIKRIFSHEYMHYTNIKIYLSNNYVIDINDPHHVQRDFNKLLYDFIASDEKIKIIKVADMSCNADVTRVNIKITDWVSQAMGK